MNHFIKAEKKGIRLRMALLAPTGYGKTYWSMTLATEFAKHYNTTIAVIDSERGSAKKYADLFEFDVLELATYEPQKYVAAIENAAEAGYGVLVVDSLSHAWAMHGGLLEQVDNFAKRMKNPNNYAAWREATPIHNKLVDTLLDFPGQLIVTMRSKMEYVMEKTKDRTTVTKIGLQPIQRDGLEFEFDFVCDLDDKHNLIVSKTRCDKVDGKIYPMRSKDFAPSIINWLGDQDNVAEQPNAILPPAMDRNTLITRLAEGLKYIRETPEAITATIQEYTCGPLLIDAADEALNKLWDAVKVEAKSKKQGENKASAILHHVVGHSGPDTKKSAKVRA